MSGKYIFVNKVYLSSYGKFCLQSIDTILRRERKKRERKKEEELILELISSLELMLNKNK